MKKHVFIGLLVSAIFLYLAFREVDFPQMMNALSQANYWWLLPGIVFMFISLAIRAQRWRYFLLPIQRVSFQKLFSAMMIGYMANNVLPLRLGEFMRAFAVGKSASISRTAAFATILVERIIDVLSLLVILGFTVFFQEFPPIVKNWGLIIFFFSLSIVVFMVFLMGRTRQTVRFIGMLISPLPLRIKKKVNRLLKSFLSGFEALRQTHNYGRILFQSLALWVLYAGIIYVTFLAFDLRLDGSSLIIASLVILVMISIGIMIPSSPGFVGTYHYMCTLGLSLFSVGQSDAVSFAVVLHISNYIPITLVGLYYFWKSNMHFKDALEEKQKTAT